LIVAIATRTPLPRHVAMLRILHAMNSSVATRSMVQSTHALDRAQMYHPNYCARDPRTGGQTTVSVNVSNVSARAGAVGATQYRHVLPETVLDDVFSPNPALLGDLQWNDRTYQQPVELPVSSFQYTAAAASRMIAGLKTIDHYGLDAVQRAGGLDAIPGAPALFGRELAAETLRRTRNAIELISTFTGAQMRSTRERDYTQGGQGFGLIAAARLTADKAHLRGPVVDALNGAASLYLPAIQNTLPARVFDDAKPQIIGELRRAAALLAQPAGPSTWTADITAADVRPLRWRSAS
jgi:hypothetical protein